MINKAQSSILTNPLTINAFIGTAGKDVTVSSNLGINKMAVIALDFRSCNGQSLSAARLPTQVVNNYGQYGDVLFPVPSLDSKVIAAFLAGATSSPSSTTSTTSSGSTTSTTSPIAPTITALTPPNRGGSIVESGTLPRFDPTPC